MTHRTIISLITPLLLAASLAGCGGASTTDPPAPTPELPDGLYEIAGYGYLITAADGVSSISLETATTCVPLPESLSGWTIASMKGPPEAPEEVMLNDQADSLSDYTLQRIASPSGGCADSYVSPSTSEAAATAAMEVLGERYPFFVERDVDWPALRRAYEPRLAAAADPESFGVVLSELLAEVGDGHTRLDGQQVLSPRGADVLQRVIEKGIDPADQAEILGGYLGAVPLSDETLDEGIRSGRLAPDVGYLRIDSFETEAATTTRAVDAALARITGTEALVIDLRANGGGSDRLARDIASRFALAEAPALVKYSGSAPQRTRQTISLAPTASRLISEGQLVVLTSALTASAAENFILMLGASGRPLSLVGEATAGELSDVVPWVLPNGVSLGIGMEVFERPDGTTPEVVGIAPDAPLAFAPWEEPDEAGRKVREAVARVVAPE